MSKNNQTHMRGSQVPANRGVCRALHPGSPAGISMESPTGSPFEGGRGDETRGSPGSSEKQLDTQPHSSASQAYTYVYTSLYTIKLLNKKRVCYFREEKETAH